MTALVNAACESFIKTLKYEEVYCTEYRDLAAPLSLPLNDTAFEIIVAREGSIFYNPMTGD